MWAVSEHSRQFLQKRLEKLWSFLQAKSDLINAHLVDFFTEDTWDRLVPKDLQDELLSLSDSDLTSLPSLTTLQGERKKVETGDSKSVQERSAIVSSTTTEPGTTHICEYNKDTENFSGKCGYEKSCSPLEICRTEAQQYVLSNSGTCVSLEEVWRTLGVDSKEEDKQRFVKEHMCLKKSHEVEVLSAVVARLCHSCHIDQVVDIGSGKGYLSECLYLQHGLTVLGVDASDTNTHGAKKRSQLLEKQWPALVNRTKTPANGECSNVSEPIGEAVTNNNESRDADRKSCAAESSCDAKEQEVANIASTTQKQTSGGDRKMSSKGGSFTPTTAYINLDTDLLTLIGIKNSDETRADLRLLLTGLHTCGDLCPTMLRLFVTCPQAAVLCSVGCCYNLLTEQETGTGAATEEKYGFPLSHLLRTRGVSLGRTARMLSCQAVERIGTEGRLPAMSLFYRAVLQVIVRDKFGAIDRNKTVGKVAAKSKDFADYVRRALRRLQLEHADLSEEEIYSYYKQYEGKLRHLQAFIQLRACLAPCVEAVILLDRLCFLHEQPGVSYAALVPVFDPVISPRCYALLAIKE